MLRRNIIYSTYYKYTKQNVQEYIKHFNATQWLDKLQLEKLQFEKTKATIQYAYNNIPYYRRVYADLKIYPEDIRTIDDLLYLPSITKKDIVENMEEFLPHGYGKNVFWRKTSGSSGTPLSLAKGAKTLSVMDAIMYRNYGWFQINMGEKQGRYWGSPLNILDKTKSRIKDILLGRLRFSPFDVSEKTCFEFYYKLIRSNPRYIYGYSQTVYRFAHFLQLANMHLGMLNLKAVIITGEMIYPNQVEVIEDVFKCPVSNEYGCTELGIIAMQCPSKGMHLMVDNLFIEFIKGNKAAAPGEEGEIVLTELYSEIMPLIRYRLGDIGIKSEDKCGCGRGLPLLKEIKGRADDFIACANGRQIDPIVFEYILQEIPANIGKVMQFRITQTKYTELNIEVCYEGQCFGRMAEELERRLKRIVGAEFEIRFSLKEMLEAEPSGKLRCFVSHLAR
ncbi:MAG: hypothetical protein VB050_17025 [Geobacteraceae bacterium]|nr:hypothetical protein [Geobacteraceae bacterium]